MVFLPPSEHPPPPLPPGLLIPGLTLLLGDPSAVTPPPLPLPPLPLLSSTQQPTLSSATITEKSQISSSSTIIKDCSCLHPPSSSILSQKYIHKRSNCHHPKTFCFKYYRSSIIVTYYIPFYYYPASLTL